LLTGWFRHFIISDIYVSIQKNIFMKYMPENYEKEQHFKGVGEKDEA